MTSAGRDPDVCVETCLNGYDPDSGVPWNTWPAGQGPVPVDQRENLAGRGTERVRIRVETIPIRHPGIQMPL